jgi:hypothetical protein
MKHRDVASCVVSPFHEVFRVVEDSIANIHWELRQIFGFPLFKFTLIEEDSIPRSECFFTNMITVHTSLAA